MREKILESRDAIEHEIWWDQKVTYSIWHDNWTRLGDLYRVVLEDFNINEDIQDMEDLMEDARLTKLVPGGYNGSC